VDRAGRVYIAAGQIFVYSPAGRDIEKIEVPERPIQRVFGGKGDRTMFIAARASLYAVRMLERGRQCYAQICRGIFRRRIDMDRAWISA
jgi:sugar lactone lactonase YvrE